MVSYCCTPLSAQLHVENIHASLKFIKQICLKGAGCHWYEIELNWFSTLGCTLRNKYNDACKILYWKVGGLGLSRRLQHGVCYPLLLAFAGFHLVYVIYVYLPWSIHGSILGIQSSGKKFLCGCIWLLHVAALARLQLFHKLGPLHLSRSPVPLLPSNEFKCIRWVWQRNSFCSLSFCSHVALKVPWSVSAVLTLVQKRQRWDVCLWVRVAQHAWRMWLQGVQHFYLICCFLTFMLRTVWLARLPLGRKKCIGQLNCLAPPLWPSSRLHGQELQWCRCQDPHSVTATTLRSCRTQCKHSQRNKHGGSMWFM